MLPFNMSQQANVHEKDQQDTTQGPNASKRDQNTFSNLENLKSDNEKSEKGTHPSSSAFPSDILHGIKQIKVADNSKNDADLEAVELDYDADKNSTNYKIDDDCLLYIFSFLPIYDLIKIERVCKRWRKISLKSWRRLKFVNIYRDFGISALEPNRLEHILSRCGNYITGFEFSCSQALVQAHTSTFIENTQLQPDDAMKLINKYCKKLNYLNICCTTFMTKKSYLNSLNVNILKNLKSLGIGRVHYYHIEELSNVGEIFRKYGDLNSVACIGIENKILHLLNNNYGTIVVTHFETFSNGMLKKVLEKCGNLQNLDISGTSVVLNTLLPFTKQFECLVLCFMRTFFEDEISNFNLFRCPNLRVLDISLNYSTLSSEIFSILIGNCPNIEDLRVANSTLLKDEDFSVLKKLKNLMYLDVSFTEISNETLIGLSETSGKLKQLKIYGCVFIDSSGIAKVINTFKELSYLYVSTSVLTEQFIKSALLSLQERNNTVGLTIRLKQAIPHFEEKIDFKSLNCQSGRKNVMRIVSGLTTCDCNFYETCFCFNGLDTVAYFG